MATETWTRQRPPAHLQALVDRVEEAAADPVYAQRKEMWTRHNRLEKVAKTPVYVCLKPGSGPTNNPVAWQELIPVDSRLSEEPLEREIELQLRQKLYKHDHIPDDEVLLPTVWVDAVPPSAPAAADAGRPALAEGFDAEHPGGARTARLWGLPFKQRRSGGVGGAYGVEPVVSGEEDLALLQYPQYQVDETATRELVERATELVDGRLPVKVLTDEVGFSPTETMISLMGMEAVLFGVVDRPAFISRLMDFITEGAIVYQLEREAAGDVDAEQTWRYRVEYEELPPGADPHRLASCWPTIAAQSMGGVSPAMYEEFVQPYHARLAAIAGEDRVYYHGCENLTAKIPIIRQLPNLRRFHVSPWTNLAAAAEQMERDFVLEVVPHPDTLHIQTPSQMREALERIMDVAGDCILDINLGGIETVFGDPQVLSTWAGIAQEVTERYAQ